MRSMHRYAVFANYIQIKDFNQNKVVIIDIDGRPKTNKNIARFINSTRPGTTRNPPNCIFEGLERN